jgi:hypothetical protein
MMGFRSSRSTRNGSDAGARGTEVGFDSDRTDRDRSFGRRLVGIVGEVGSAISTPRGGSSSERR